MVLVELLLVLLVDLQPFKEVIQYFFKVVGEVVEHMEVVPKQVAVVVELKEMVVVMVDLVEQLKVIMVEVAVVAPVVILAMVVMQELATVEPGSLDLAVEAVAVEANLVVELQTTVVVE